MINQSNVGAATLAPVGAATVTPAGEATKKMASLLFEQFRMNGYDLHLAHLLIDSLLEYLDDKCTTGNRTSMNDNDIICRIHFKYQPNPVDMSEKIINGSLVNRKIPISKGRNGFVYEDLFDGLPIINKAVNEDQLEINQNLQEAVINMSIINKFLIANPKVFPSLVPTYGFFLCKQLQTPNDLQICTVPDSGVSYLNIIQKKIENTIPFNDFILTAIATLDILQKILSKIIIQLIHLQESGYQLYHGDLHGDNILVTQDGSQCWIIDWGQAGFTINGKRYKGIGQDDYQYPFKDLRNVPINTGAVDIYFLLEILTDSYHENVRHWAIDMKRRLFTELCPFKKLEFDISLGAYKKRNIKSEDTASIQSETYQFNSTINSNNDIEIGCFWLYYFLKEMEEFGDDKDRLELHKENVSLLNQYTYRVLFGAMIQLDKNWQSPFSLPARKTLETIVQEVSTSFTGKRNRLIRKKKSTRKKKTRRSKK